MIERLAKKLDEGQDDLRASIRTLRDRDGDLDAGLKALASSSEANAKRFLDALGAAEDARKADRSAAEDARRADREDFKKSLDKQTEASLAALQTALLTTLAQKVGSWVVTSLITAALGYASWLAVHH